MTHDEASELLGAYALDAVDGDECVELEAHLDSCPRCRAELDGLRDIAAAMGNSVEPLPEGLWSQIASKLPEHRDDDEPPPMPQLVGHDASPFRSPGKGARRRRRITVGAVSALAAAAAVAIALGIGLVHANDKVSRLQSVQGTTAPATVAAALHTPGHRVVTLDSHSGAQLAQVVVVPSGQGYLVSSELPRLGRDQTYQLWAIEGNQPISLGLLGTSPRQVAFTMAGSSRPSHLSITAEPAGGSVFPTGSIIATGTV